MRSTLSLLGNGAAFAAKYVLLPAVLMYAAWWLFQRPVHTVSIAVSRAQVVSRNRPEAGEFQLLWKNQKVDTADVITLSFRNVGNEPIYASDFSPRLTMQFWETCTVARASAKGSREQLVPELVTDTRSVALKPLNLDVGDAVEVTALVVDAPGSTASDAVAISGYVLRVGDLGKVTHFAMIPTTRDQSGRMYLPEQWSYVLAWIMPLATLAFCLWLWFGSSYAWRLALRRLRGGGLESAPSVRRIRRSAPDRRHRELIRGIRDPVADLIEEVERLKAEKRVWEAHGKTAEPGPPKSSPQGPADP